MGKRFGRTAQIEWRRMGFCCEFGNGQGLGKGIGGDRILLRRLGSATCRRKEERRRMGFGTVKVAAGMGKRNGKSRRWKELRWWMERPVKTGGKSGMGKRCDIWWRKRMG